MAVTELQTHARTHTNKGIVIVQGLTNLEIIHAMKQQLCVKHTSQNHEVDLNFGSWNKDQGLHACVCACVGGRGFLVVEIV